MIFTGTFFGTARPNEYSRRGAAQGFAAIQRQQSARDERGCGTGRARDHSAGSDADPPEYDAEIQALSGPISTIPVPLAGDIEDTATNAVDAASRLRRIVENLYGIVGIELMHAAQAIDLRLQENPSLKLGVGTRGTFESFRTVVPFLDQDRPLTPDIAAATRYMRGSGGAVSP